ncbi:hypothetical protein [[Phormidium] sp. ETS-05]|uniref:hypothetical protein n=1 Tax=[Phormidium] sp. ETS-05 TaxID=222819 RepID=UPI0018EEFE2B|nr:hypothetical protein [[Phormidium] sp. ETS-05]
MTLLGTARLRSLEAASGNEAIALPQAIRAPTALRHRSSAQVGILSAKSLIFINFTPVRDARG